jgi:RNA polymerase sigma factor (sigma-70 family)
MRDSEMVAAIVAGDSDGLAAAYDRYAAALHAYCRSLLTEPADAADAVQDTFIIAAAKVAGLRNRERLRPWLYAVARNECHRKLRARATATGLDEAGDVTDESADVGARAERAELRELVSAAVAGLNPADREVIELNLRHELDGADLADALGVPRNHAHALASRARAQFETSLGVLLVARSGRPSCPDLDEMLAGWDGQLTVLMRKRLNRHIEHCDVCGERKRRELRPAMLLGLLPVVALPSSLRQQVLRLVSDDGPAARAYRARVGRRSEPYGPDGFPVPVAPLGRARSPRRYGLAAGAVAALLVLGGGAVIVASLLGGGPGHAAASLHPPATTSAPSPSGFAALPPSTGPATPSPTASVTTPAAPLPQPPPTTAQPIAPPAPRPTRTTQPPHTPRPSPSPSRSPTPPPPPPPGTLTVSATSVVLQVPPNGGIPTGSFTLTANGGPVTYSIALPAGSAPTLAVTPSSGTLAAGQTQTITVTWSAESSLNAQLTISPGGATVNVSFSLPT